MSKQKKRPAGYITDTNPSLVKSDDMPVIFKETLGTRETHHCNVEGYSAGDFPNCETSNSLTGYVD